MNCFHWETKRCPPDLAGLSEELDSYQKTRRSWRPREAIPTITVGRKQRQTKQDQPQFHGTSPFRNDFAQPQPMKTFNSTFRKSSYTVGTWVPWAGSWRQGDGGDAYEVMSGAGKTPHKHPCPSILESSAEVALIIEYVRMQPTERPYCFQQPTFFSCQN